jgi:hypothetical protein
MTGNGKDEFREKLLFLAETDALEQATLPQALFDQRGRPDQSFLIRAGKADIDDHPVLDGVMGDDPVGIGQDKIILGQRRHQIGIKGKTVQACQEESRHSHKDQEDERPS